MVFMVYLIVNAGVTFVFFKSLKKHLTPLEILLYWCVASLFVQNYVAIQTMNLKSSVIPDELSLGMTNLLNRTVLHPVLSLIFMNQYRASQRAKAKWICILGYTALATGTEWLACITNVFVHVWWRYPWSVAYWFMEFLLLIGFMKVYRHYFMTGAPTSR